MAMRVGGNMHDEQSQSYEPHTHAGESDITSTIKVIFCNTN